VYGKNDRSTKEVLLQDSSYSYDEEDDSSVEEAAFIETKWDRRQHKNGTSKYPKRQWEVGRSRKKLKKYYKDVHELQEKMSALDQNELSSTDKPAAVREEIDVTKKTILKNRTSKADSSDTMPPTMEVDEVYASEEHAGYLQGVASYTLRSPNLGKQ